MADRARNVMLAQKYDDGVNPTGWWMSEKLDGVRAYWSGSKFYSRQGNQFIAPSWFTKDLPKEPLDGELWCGRGLFQKTLSIIKKTVNPEKYADDWKYVTYLVFDAPQRSEKGMKYEERVAWLEANILPQSETTYAAVVGVCKCTGRDHLQKMLKQVLMKGGEGIMLRKPQSLYECTRSYTLLKVKHFHDEEAKVLRHEKGSGRCQNMCGKIVCVLPNGVEFKIGSGFTDAQRRNPPKIGSVVTFKYQEMSDHGHPRFPVFLRERGDMTWADVMANAKTKAPFSSLKKGAVPLLQKQHSILFSTIPSRDQTTGKKVVTSNDADDDLDEEAKKGLLLTKGYSTAGAVSAAADGGATVGKKRPAAAAASSGKPLCRFHPNCFRKNPDHLKQYDHPAAETGGDAEEDGEDEDDLPEGHPDEPRNKDMPDDPKDPDYEEEGKKAKKRAKTDAVKTPGAPASSSTAAAVASPSSSPKKPAQRACYYGLACYNKDPAHLAKFSHPSPPPPPQTKEEFIETTNQSQVDLAEYYQFGGDEEEEDVVDLLVADRNERRMSIQKFNENRTDKAEMPTAPEEEVDEDADEQDVKTIIDAARKSFAHHMDGGYFAGCASDDEDGDAEMAKTVAMKDLPPRPAAPPIRVPSAASGAPTVISGGRSGVAASAAAVAPAPEKPLAHQCTWILPELLLKATRVIDTPDGEELCKRCKCPVGDHRESR